jgi:hypothetical protein
MTAQSEIMGLNNVAIRATAKPGERAWPGDFKVMQLSTSKIKRRGWKPGRNSDESVRLATRQLVK